jgi:hypothetical protein
MQSHYRSLVQDYFQQPLCITWYSGLRTVDVLVGIGGLSTTATERTFSETVGSAYDSIPRYAGAALAGGLDDWVLLLEPNGFQAHRTDVLSTLSREGQALSIMWNLDADYSIAYAEGGHVVSHFDPLESVDEVPDRLTTLMRVEDFEDDWKAAALALGERLTGIRLEASWLTATHTSMLVESIQIVAEDSVTEEQRQFLASETRVEAIVADPRIGRVREIALLIAETACASTGLQGRLIDSAFAALTILPSDPSVIHELRSKIQTWRRDLISQAASALNSGNADSTSTADELHRQGIAAGVVVAALEEDPVVAATDAIWRIGMLRLDDIGSRRVGTLWTCLDKIKEQPFDL